MATDVVGEGMPPEAAESLLPQLHRGRFLVVYIVLGLVLGAAAAGVVIAANLTGGGGPAVAWSKWHPTEGGLGASEQIAAHVGGQYRIGLGSGQLVDVIAKPPAVSVKGTKVPLSYLAVRGGQGEPDHVDPISASDSVMYTLCGLGPSCTIATGTPTVARGRVVLREIIELALYTFHYEPGIQNVVALMPPRSPTTASVAVYLQRADLAQQLRSPLNRTLAPAVPSPGTMTRAEIRLVDDLTGPRVYSFSLTQAQDGNAVLVLARITA